MSGFSVTESIDRHVDRLETPREPDGHHHPSSLSGCPRKALYTFRGVPKSNPPEARSRRIFRLGHLFHDFIQEALEKDEAVGKFYREVKLFDPELNIKGAADGLAVLTTGKLIVIELKSIGTYSWRSKNLPQPDHVEQATTYVKVLRDYGGRATSGVRDADGEFIYDVVIPPMPMLTSVRFCYVNKESGETKEFDVNLTPPKEAALRERVRVLDEHLLNDTMPGRLPLVANKKTGDLEKDWQCRYCDHHDTCWEAPE